MSEESNKREDVQRQSRVLNEGLCAVLRDEAAERGLTFEGRGDPLSTDDDDSLPRPPFYVGGVGPIEIAVKASPQWGVVGTPREEEFDVDLKWPESPEEPKSGQAVRTKVTHLAGRELDDLSAGVVAMLDVLFPETAPAPDQDEGSLPDA